MAQKVYELAKKCVSTLPKCESTKILIMQECKSLNAICEAKQSSQQEMQRLASLLPEYDIVMGMEGAGPITGPTLMAEIGDVRRFKNKKALVALWQKLETSAASRIRKLWLHLQVWMLHPFSLAHLSQSRAMFPSVGLLICGERSLLFLE